MVGARRTEHGERTCRGLDAAPVDAARSVLVTIAPAVPAAGRSPRVRRGARPVALAVMAAVVLAALGPALRIATVSR